jgi:HSP20 family protein
MFRAAHASGIREMPHLTGEVRSRLSAVANPLGWFARAKLAPDEPYIHSNRGIIMSLIKWQPFGEFDDAFSRLMPALFARNEHITGKNGKFAWAPSADISETDQEYLIRAELPAVRKEDVKVTLDQGVITIHGERKEDKETKEEKFHRMETFRGTFSRSFSVPDNIDEKAIRAESRDGVLTVHLPKTRTTTARTVEVKVQ